MCKRLLLSTGGSDAGWCWTVNITRKKLSRTDRGKYQLDGTITDEYPRFLSLALPRSPSSCPSTLVQYSRPSCSRLMVGMHFTRHKRGKPSKNRNVFNSKWHESVRVTCARVVVLVVVRFVPVRSVLTCHLMFSEYCSHQTQCYLHSLPHWF